MAKARKDTAPITIDTPAYACRTVALGDWTVAFETIRRGGDAAPLFQGCRTTAVLVRTGGSWCAGV